jgi:alkylation response protein AidB-like acyl-CoA dehydrogenase
VDLDLSSTEAAVSAACRQILERHAGPSRATSLAERGQADVELGDALQSAGYLDLFGEEQAGPGAAGLVAELAAEAAAVLPIGARVLVGPAVCGATSLPPLVTVAEDTSTSMVRFGAQAEVLLLLGGDEARLLTARDWDAQPVINKYGYPFAEVEILRPGSSLGPGTAETARRWWRVALASEIAGTARAAVELTTRYLKEREQFGKPLGANQALAHRIVACAVHAEGARWLARQAAGLGAPADLGASAAVAAAIAARVITNETHQLTGAMGFTLEYDLHVWSLRLQALRVEAGGIASHANALTNSRWGQR